MSKSLSNKQYLRSLRLAFLFAWRAERRFFVFLLFASVAKGSLPIAGIYFNSRLIGLLAENLHAGSSTDSVLRESMVLVACIGVAAIAGQAINRLSDAVSSLYQRRIANYIQRVIAEKLSSLDVADFEHPEFYSLIQTVSNEVSHRPLVIYSNLLSAVAAACVALSFVAVILFWRPWLLLIVIAPAAVSIFMSVRTAEDAVAQSRKRAEGDRGFHYVRSLLTSDVVAKEIRLLRLQGYLLAKMDSLWKILYKQESDFIRQRSVRKGAVGLLESIRNPIIIAYCAAETIRGAISVAQFSFYTQSISTLSQQLQSLATTTSQLHENNLFLSSLFAILDRTPLVESSLRQTVSEMPVGVPRVEFKHVSFSYPNTNRRVISDLSFDLLPGQTLAILGNNGAGKSTIVKLLAGLYEPTAGQILLDGVDIATLNREVLRSKVGVVLQDFGIYHFSVYENIGLGDVGEMATRSKVEEAGASSGISDVVKSLPDGYDTVLGRQYKRGHELSGGQKQLVALARGIMRSSPILVLDEPSAALDAANEARFFGALLGTGRAGRSVILICHRISLARQADKIIVIENGELVESGTHDELLTARGTYFRLAASSASN